MEKVFKETTEFNYHLPSIVEGESKKEAESET